MRYLFRVLFIVFIAISLAVFSTILISSVSEVFGWVYFSAWGLGHGTIFIVFPVLVICFIFLLTRIWKV